MATEFIDTYMQTYKLDNVIEQFSVDIDITITELLKIYYKYFYLQKIKRSKYFVLECLRILVTRHQNYVSFLANETDAIRRNTVEMVVIDHIYEEGCKKLLQNGSAIPTID